MMKTNQHLEEYACRVCGNVRGHKLHYPREMLFGTGEEFEYLECGYCGCIQITEIPSDLGKYYPSDAYYSYSPPRLKNYPGWMMDLRIRRSRAFVGQGDLLGKLIARCSKENEHFSWLRRAGLGLDARIVDIGCGSGKLILQMHRDGFHNICGLDSFINETIDYGNGVIIHKGSLESFQGEFDFLMLHHSFEHMDNPLGVLQKLRRLVAKDGCVFIRLPLSDSYVRRGYGIHWFAWDAPRHLFLHTVKSMHILAELAGFEIWHIKYDSTMQQFEAAEDRIRCGVRNPSPINVRMSGLEMRAMRRKVAELNDLRDGDQAGFYLRPIND